MSGKHVYSLSDENRELQRQIGCMNGIFQLFDRQHFFSGRRHGGGRSQKRLPAGQIANPEYNSVITAQKGNANGEDTKEPMKQMRNQRTSFESPPRTSLSSSFSSSTYSSVDNNRTNQAEPSPSKTLSTTTSRQQPTALLNSRNQAIDLRDVVKDSIYKEPQRLAVKKTNRGSSHTIKHIDSPRPSLLQSPSSSSHQILRSKYAPRFSYDGRESRDKWTATMKLKELPRLSLDSKQGRSNDLFREERKESQDGTHRRSSSVVAKLMGLEGLSDSVSSERFQPIDVKSSYRHDDNLETTPRPASRFPVEPAPWKNQEGGRNSQKPPPSVYGQIEKRLTDLEFKSSGKDLRALKQILEAMEKTRERLEIKKEEQKPVVSKNIESSIVIMKPAMFAEKRTSGLKKLRNKDEDIMGRKNMPVDKILSHVKTTKSINSSKLPQPLPKSPTSCRRTTSPVSPRMLQSHTGSQSPESCRVRRQQYNQTIDQSSPGRKIKLKSFSSKKGDKCATRTQQGDVASVQSDSNVSIVSQSDTEIQSTDHMEDAHSLYRQSSQDRREQLRKDTRELFTSIEQPSPVSVLDATFYREGSPSPVRKISNAFRDDETQNSEEIEWSTVEFDHLLKPTMFTQEKLENINQLVQKLRELNTGNGETEASYIAYSSEDQNPDHSYITQILLASGLLLKDLRYTSTFMQHKPSEHLLNPSLFLVLEQTKGNIQQPSDISDKIHRKLIFDIVNEILVEKISKLEYSKPQKCQSGPMLLKELCSEVDHLQAEANRSLLEEDDYFLNILSDEIMRKSENWNDYRSETPALVLDIERLIFKDIINELVRGEEVALPGSRVNKHCKLLFPQ